MKPSGSGIHGMEALVYNNHPREAAASRFWVYCQQRTLVPPFNSGANAALVSVQVLPVHSHYSAGTDGGRGSLESTGNRVSDLMCLT